MASVALRARSPRLLSEASAARPAPRPAVLRRAFGAEAPRSQRRTVFPAHGPDPRREPSQLGPSELAAAIRVASQVAEKTDPRMWRAYAEQALVHKNMLTPKQMAFIASGFANASVPDREVFACLTERAIEEVHEFEPRDTALLLNSYAKLQLREVPLFRTFALALRRGGSDGFGEQQLALVLNAYARLEIKDLPLFQLFGRWVEKRSADFTPQGIATAANAYAKVRLRDPAIVHAVSDIADRLEGSFAPQHLANLLSAFARLEYRDLEITERLAGQVARQIGDFGPVELAATSHAVFILRIQDKEALGALTSMVRKKAGALKTRQLATTVHAFSTANLAYGSLLADMGRHVIRNMKMADNRSTVLLLCAYARASQAALEPREGRGEIVPTLVSHLQPKVHELDLQTLSNVFYALGRLGLQTEPMAGQVARILRSLVRPMSPQHISNTMFTISRLGLRSNAQFRLLLESLQDRAAGGGDRFEPLHLANMLQALAAIHGIGAPTNALSAALPVALVPSLARRTLDPLAEVTWLRRPLLVAACAVSCARLGAHDGRLFALASRCVRAGESPVPLPRHTVADLMAAFAEAKPLDVDFFAWALEEHFRGDLQMPISLVMQVLGALDFASHKSASARRAFRNSPEPFQAEVSDFYRRAALALLAGAESLPATLLEAAAVPFARAGLLDDVAPFDLLGASSRERAEMRAKTRPDAPLRSSASPLIAEMKVSDEDVDVAEHSDSVLPALPEARPETALEYLLAELDSTSSTNSQALVDGPTLAPRLARYVALLRKESGGQRTPSVPAAVLDVIIRQSGEQLVPLASNLPFSDITYALATFTEAGIRPPEVFQILTEAAERCFPTRSSHADVEAVAALCNALNGAKNLGASSGRAAAFRLYVRLQFFAERLVIVTRLAGKDGGVALLGERPLRTIALLATSLRHVETLAATVTHSLLLLASPIVVAGLQSTSRLGDPDGEAAARRFDDAANLFLALLEWEAGDGELREDLGTTTAVLLSLLLTQTAAGGHLTSARLLGVLRTIGASPALREEAHLDLAAGLLGQLVQRTAKLDPSGLSTVLEAISSMNMLGLRRDGTGHATAEPCSATLAVVQRLAVRCGYPARGEILAARTGKPAGRELLPWLIAPFMRPLLISRRLEISEAVQAADFCIQALKAPALSEREQAEASRGLAVLLAHLCREQTRWSVEDRQAVAGVATLLCSESPDFLRGSSLSRIAQVTLEELRSL